MKQNTLSKEVIVGAKYKALKMLNMIKTDSMYNKDLIKLDLIDLIRFLEENEVRL